jgi:transcriptional regulator with XRE-family HTH domain
MNDMSVRIARSAIEMTDESFGSRLRSERERRRIALEAIAENTKIGIGLLKGLERNDLSRWPSGIFRRSFIKSYAAAIGLDADETVREFLEHFPDPPEQLSAVDAAAAAADKGKAPATRTVLRLTLAEAHPPFSSGRLLRRFPQRLAAVAWDTGSMLAVAVTAFMFIDQFWVPLGITLLCYYSAGILILGNTPGVCLFAPRTHDDDPGDPAAARNLGLDELPSEPLFGLGPLLR